MPSDIVKAALEKAREMVVEEWLGAQGQPNWRSDTQDPEVTR